MLLVVEIFVCRMSSASENRTIILQLPPLDVRQTVRYNDDSSDLGPVVLLGTAALVSVNAIFRN
jgi:hypothetical protein